MVEIQVQSNLQTQLLKFIIFLTRRSVLTQGKPVQLISTFNFTIKIVQSLFFLIPKFQASTYLLGLYSLVCFRPGLKPRKQIFCDAADLSPGSHISGRRSSLSGPYLLFIKYKNMRQQVCTLSGIRELGGSFTNILSENLGWIHKYSLICLWLFSRTGMICNRKYFVNSLVL